MKYLLEGLLLALIWLFGSLAVDSYHALEKQQKALQLANELNRFTIELSLETLTASNSSVYHFDKHAQKQLGLERVSNELRQNDSLSKEVSLSLNHFSNLVVNYMQLATMLKTSYRYISSLGIQRDSFLPEEQSLLSSVLVLVSNLQVAHELPRVQEISLRLMGKLALLREREAVEPRFRLLRLHSQFILDNFLKASNYLLPIQEGGISEVIQKNIDHLNRRIERNYWQLISDVLLTLFGVFVLVAVVFSRLMAQLKEANKQAKQAAETKSLFLSNMSHEIRTPMNGILGLTDILLATELNSVQRNYLEKVRFSANSLTTIINDILDFSKIESKKLHIEHVPFEFADLLDNLRTLMTPMASAKGICLIFDIDPNLREQYIGDPVRINQILLNLSSNAVKFTEEGAVTVSIRSEVKEKGQQWITIAVTDTGIGISQEQIESLFERFSQAESSTTRKYGGTGLGLTICKLLTELMGGEIKISSRLGCGSTFSVRIPLDTAFRQGDLALTQYSGSMLVVEDDPVTLEVSMTLAQSLGLKVVGVQSGREALQALTERRFDILLLDWVLPDFEPGAILTEVQKVTELPDQVVIYTAHTENFIQTDNAYPIIYKPLLKRDLIELLTQKGAQPVGNASVDQALIGECSAEIGESLAEIGESSADTNPQSPEQTSLERVLAAMELKVLLVEDNEINQMIAVTLLEQMGITVTTAMNGQEAVDTVIAQNGQFDLVLMDIQMPIMDGMEATRLLRDKFNPEQLKIIALTANVMQDETNTYSELGMNGFLAKPFELSQLQAIIVEHSGVTKH
ncbi:response regulator [Litoribacillus peritrichatus]|uniref:histidine kinase n=1 Tax=Litoribacillus peritrichatus TaxID=718191 RepID=A0ABP7M643_9GAMM